jgi:hypothetical protein
MMHVHVERWSRFPRPGCRGSTAANRGGSVPGAPQQQFEQRRPRAAATSRPAVDENQPALRSNTTSAKLRAPSCAKHRAATDARIRARAWSRSNGLTRVVVGAQVDEPRRSAISPRAESTMIGTELSSRRNRSMNSLPSAVRQRQIEQDHVMHSRRRPGQPVGKRFGDIDRKAALRQMRPHQLEEPPIVFDRKNTHVLSGPDDKGTASATMPHIPY